MKIHLPLSWPRVGAGVLLGFPGWKIISPSPGYISRPVWSGSQGPTQGSHSTGEEHTDELQADMKMLKVEELVCKTYYFLCNEYWFSLNSYLKIEIPLSFRHNAQVL